MSQELTKKQNEKIAGNYFLKPPNLSQVIRLFADNYSANHCNIPNAISYAEGISGNRCFYCGKSTEKDLEYDHLYPASRFNLFCAGNIVKSCKSCNIEKSNKNPKYYIGQRFSRSLPTLFSKGDYERKISNMESTYKKLHPKFYEIGVLGSSKSPNEILIEEFLSNDSVKVEFSKPSKIEETLYTSVWEIVIENLSKVYAESRVKQYIGRIVYLDSMLEKDYQGQGFGEFNKFCSYCRNLLYNIAIEKSEYTLDIRNILIELMNVLYGEKAAQAANHALPKNKDLWRFKR